LRGISGLFTAFFSVLEPRQYIKPHWGYWKGFVRYHLGVIIPNDNADRKCWLRVNADAEDNKKRDKSLVERGQKYFWHEGQGIVFDDTFLHDAANDSDEVRVVLWLDIKRKMPLPFAALNSVFLGAAQWEPSVARFRKSAVVA
jgi:beta-hydroxylase